MSLIYNNHSKIHFLFDNHKSIYYNNIAWYKLPAPQTLVINKSSTKKENSSIESRIRTIWKYFDY